MPGLQEYLVIAVVALLVIGPDRLPAFARQAGRLVARLREETRRGVGELRRVSEIQGLEQEIDSLRHELRGVRRDVSGPLRGGSAPGQAAPRTRARAGFDLSPAPFDPEAT